jgi:hypothetical protein
MGILFSFLGIFERKKKVTKVQKALEKGEIDEEDANSELYINLAHRRDEMSGFLEAWRDPNIACN